MAVPTQLSDLSATAASNSPAGGDTVGTTMDDYIRSHASIIARISAGTDALATPALGAATGTSLVLSGLATVNGAFTSLGLDDNATAKALTLSGSGANSVTISNSATNPTIGTSGGGLELASNSGAISSINNIVGGKTFTFQNSDSGAGSFAVAYVTSNNGNISIQMGATAGGGTGTIGYSGTNVFNINASGASVPINLMASNVTQVRILGTASADRYITLTGSNGGNPTIGTSAGNLAITATPVVNASVGNTLQYFDLVNNSTGASAGSIVRLITSDAAGTGTAIVDIVKYKSGSFYIGNNETSASGYIGFRAADAEQVRITPTASADRYITLTGSNGGNPTIGTSAGDLLLSPAGGAVVSFGTYSAKAAEAFAGYITIKDAAGNSRKVMICA